MNTVRIGVITVCVAVGASAHWFSRDAATGDVRPAQESRAQAEQLLAGDRVRRDVARAPEGRTLEDVGSPAPEPDATELTQPTPTLDDVLDAVNADIGPEGKYIDREALAAMLSSDPELGRLLDESEF
jgi:hypothetical protein